MKKEQVLKIVSEVLSLDVYDAVQCFKEAELHKIYRTISKADFLSQLSLALDKEESQAMKDFARSIVEQSVPEEKSTSECDCIPYEACGCVVDDFNLCRSQTLSNADNLLK